MWYEFAIYNKKLKISIENGINSLDEINLGNDLETGEYEVTVTILKDKLIDYSSSIIFNVFYIDRRRIAKDVAIIKNNNRIIDFLKKYNINYEIFSKSTSIDVPVIINDIYSDFTNSKDGNVIEKNKLNRSDNLVIKWMM